jgi:CHAT domain-containing protein
VLAGTETLAHDRAKLVTTNALVVGNPAMPLVKASDGESISLSPLPGAEHEGQWVAHRLGIAALSGTAASEAEIRRRIVKAPLVHLATHGYAYASETHARDSFVALAPGEGHDGLLTVGEVIDQLPALTTELVVLSACQTGLGDIKEAEGTVGLQRAFLAKGAKSVLVSLWSVSDQATELLMKKFYTHRLDDSDQPNKAEALRRAQQDVRKTPGFAPPRYWAAFQLVGAK